MTRSLLHRKECSPHRVASARSVSASSPPPGSHGHMVGLRPAGTTRLRHWAKRLALSSPLVEFLPDQSSLLSPRSFSTSITMAQKFRKERDSFGDLEVPAERYWVPRPSAV